VLEQIAAEPTAGRHVRRRGIVVLMDADDVRRRILGGACRAAGLRVYSVASVAELQRWPDGDIVVAGSIYITPLWRQVGAVEVIALVDDASEGMTAVTNGATRWLAVPQSPSGVAALIALLVARHCTRPEDAASHVALLVS
jgi:hypothetical protein